MNCQNERDISQFLKGKGTDRERRAMESHFSGCSSCRSSLTNLHRKKNEESFSVPEGLKERAKNLPKEKNHRKPFLGGLWKWKTAFATAGFVILFSVVGFWVWNAGQPPVSDDGDVLRSGEQNLNKLRLLSPDNGGKLGNEEIEFTWKPIKNVTSYVLIVSDAKGDIVFEKQTKKENLRVTNTDANLVSGTHYFWYVRANLIDGRILSAQPRKFSVERIKP